MNTHQHDKTCVMPPPSFGGDWKTSSAELPSVVASRTTYDTLGIETLNLAKLFINILDTFQRDNWNNKYVETSVELDEHYSVFNSIVTPRDTTELASNTLTVIQFLEKNEKILEFSIRHRGYVEDNWYDVVSDGSPIENALCYIVKTLSRVQRHVLNHIVQQIVPYTKEKYASSYVLVKDYKISQ